MTIETTNNRISYDPDGIVTDFAYDFLVFDEGDMVVYADGIVYTEPYEVTSTGDPDGGLVSFDVAPAASIEELTLLREVPLEQKTEYPPYNPFPAESHEQALDRLTMITQQLQEELDRTAKEPVNADPDLDLTFPPYDAGKALMYDETTKTITVSDDDINDITTDAQASADAAAASEAAASVSESNAAASADAASSSASAAAASEAACAASEAAVIASGDQYLIDIAAAGDAELSQIAAAGDSEIADVIAEGDTQYNRVISAGTVVNKGARQTMLAGPDLEATPSTIETAATKTGNLSSTYHDLSMDMLTGSRGGMVFGKDKAAGNSTEVQSTIVNDNGLLYTDKTDAVLGGLSNRVRQYLASGVEIGSSLAWNSTNLYAFQTTHKTVLDGNEWHYNPTSGFAMCKYVGNATARDLLHPMGKEPLFWAVKNLVDVLSWVTGRRGTDGRMVLDQTTAEAVSAEQWTAAPTDAYISMGTSGLVNGSGDDMFLFGWFGDPLDDLEVDMAGEREVTASWLHLGDPEPIKTVDTGITDIQCVITKTTATSGPWRIYPKSVGSWGTYTELNSTAAEQTNTAVQVSGSEVTVSNTNPVLVIVIGSTADAPDNKLKAATEVLRKVGTAAGGHRVDLGAPYAGGDAGGMVFGRDIELATANIVYDTVRGATNFIQTSNTTAEVVGGGGLTAFTDTGMTLGTYVAFNSTNINQYTAFNTTHKVTTSDGLEWEYNPLTGFAMCKYVGNGVAGRQLKHPMGKKLRMGWFKNLESVYDWKVYLDTIGAANHMRLNTTAASAADSTNFDDTEPNDVAIFLGGNLAVNETTVEHVFYGWFGDDLSDLEPDMTGERGVTALWQYTGGSGAMSVDTGIENIEAILFKNSSAVGDWEFINSQKAVSYTLNSTAAEGASTAVTVEGSVVSWAGGANDVEFIAFGSKADSGVDNDVVLSSTVDNPTITSMANGFDEYGQTDIIKKLTASQTLNVTGAAGKKYIYMKSDGLLYFTDVRPEYLRGYFPGVTGSHVYDIDKAVMYNASGYGPPIEQDWVASVGAPIIVDNVITFTDGGLAERATQYPMVEIGKTYRIRGNITGISGTLYPFWTSGGTATAKTTDGDFEFDWVATAETARVSSATSGVGIVTLYDIQEVITDQITPAVFLGECEVAPDGSVYDIVTYQKGDVVGTDYFLGLASTAYYEDNKFGHDEAEVDLIGKLSTGEFVKSSESVESTKELHKITLDATPDAEEYKLIVRRTF